jgi:CheY-like chemotaxis protein
MMPNISVSLGNLKRCVPLLNGAGDEAIRIFKRYRDAIRAVATHIMMPGMSGVDLARRFVSLKPGLKVLLVFA